jgi:hypothetical protein
MDATLRLTLLLLALVCFLVAAWLPTHPIYDRLVAVGLMFLAASSVTW